MRLSYYDALDIISDDVVEILESKEKQNTDISTFRPETTAEAVLQSIRKKKKHRMSKTYRNKKNIKLRLLIAAVIVLSISTVVIAVSQYDFERDGAALVNDSNRGMIGKEQHGTFTIIDKNGNVIEGEPMLSYEEMIEEYMKNIEQSTIIDEIDVKESVPSSISYFAVTPDNVKENTWNTPEIIFTNGALIVFTKEDGSGWHLEKGETIKFSGETYPSEIFNGKGQTIGYSYIVNGKLVMKNLAAEATLNPEHEFTAKESGEYYFCLICCSSDSITLKEGNITVK
ncbi:MAG TPA: hypothetical protein H9959_11570 [Candidatus Mediterraneibacter ornithocaccae]|nr:hypothetical protein [Candidatus Mediterraneibacter ornithocaccae]